MHYDSEVNYCEIIHDLSLSLLLSCVSNDMSQKVYPLIFRHLMSNLGYHSNVFSIVWLGTFCTLPLTQTYMYKDTPAIYILNDMNLNDFGAPL